MDKIDEKTFELYYQVVMKYWDEIRTYLSTEYKVPLSDFRNLQDLLIANKKVEILC